MRKALIIMIVMFGLFLAIGCGASKPVTAGENATQKQNVTDTSGIKEYTLEELAEYNGTNGKAYVAYQGKVYDVSNSTLWTGGIHKGHNAGKDLTEEMNKAPHGSEILNGFPVVGTLKK
jgi:predicted heme/steroid binding protein